MRSHLWLALMVAAPVMLVGCNKGTKPTTSVSSDEIKPDHTVTADQLLDDYRKNQIGADQKYKDKTVQISGKVASIGKMPLAGYTIDLQSSNEGDIAGVKCILLPNDKPTEEKAGKLKEGDSVTLIGKCEGKAAGQFLYLKFCYFPK
jgi:hypothetical protein